MINTQSIRRYVYDNRWTIGFFDLNFADLLSGKEPQIHWLKHNYRNRWFADPFILDVTNDKLIVLVEEYYDPIRRGRISKLIIDKKTYRLEKLDVVLELSTHLSFPAILRRGGKIYIYPENSQSSALTLYEYNPKDNSCMPVTEMCRLPLADAILTDLFGGEKLIATKVPNQNGDELIIYRTLDNAVSEEQVYKFNSNIARNAGDWIKYNDIVYRPAQDCNRRYGGAVIIQKVIDTDKGLVFENVIRLEKKYKFYDLGCHTFNTFKNMAVIDVNGYRRPFLAKLGEFVAKLRGKNKWD